MGSAERLGTLFLFLLFFLVGLAYFVGLSTDVASVGGVLKQLALVGTGRNSQGNFAAYPAAGN